MMRFATLLFSHFRQIDYVDATFDRVAGVFEANSRRQGTFFRKAS